MIISKGHSQDTSLRMSCLYNHSYLFSTVHWLSTCCEIPAYFILHGMQYCTNMPTLELSKDKTHSLIHIICIEELWRLLTTKNKQ